MIVYLSGGIFDAKHLLGNAILARKIRSCSAERYSCMLPQDDNSTTAREIRDACLKYVMTADVGLFLFDGSELDSGTVVEFMLAKFADIPAVILRTDFRKGGDHEYPWNLMASFFPRTEVIVIDSMVLYKEMLAENHTSSKAAKKVTDHIARKVIGALDKVMETPPLMPSELVGPVFKWLATFSGPKLPPPSLPRCGGGI